MDGIDKCLSKPWFVLRMNWSRMGIPAKERWILNLREACKSTMIECDKWLWVNSDPPTGSKFFS